MLTSFMDEHKVVCVARSQNVIISPFQKIITIEEEEIKSGNVQAVLFYVRCMSLLSNQFTFLFGNIARKCILGVTCCFVQGLRRAL